MRIVFEGVKIFTAELTFNDSHLRHRAYNRLAIAGLSSVATEHGMIGRQWTLSPMSQG